MPDEKPKVIVAITIQMFEDGQVAANVQAQDQLAVFTALGNTIQHLALEYRKKTIRKVEIAPASFLQQLPNN